MLVSWKHKQKASVSTSPRKEVIRDMSNISQGILAKCIDAREEEQDSSDKSDLEVKGETYGRFG